MKLSEREGTEMMIGIPLVIIGITTILVFDTPLVIFAVCALIEIAVLAYIARLAFLPRRLKAPRILSECVGPRKVGVTFTEYTDEGRPITVKVDGDPVARIWAGGTVEIGVRPEQTVVLEPYIGDGITLPSSEGDISAYVYPTNPGYAVTYCPESVKRMLKNEFDEDHARMRRMFPVALAIGLVILIVIGLFVMESL
ncbi:MAG: hypothetical protein Q4Q58_02220 [Thermoplasmata archaeon]|nr:hypothetical protein [Thermoplasmata archaeon]